MLWVPTRQRLYIQIVGESRHLYYVQADPVQMEFDVIALPSYRGRNIIRTLSKYKMLALPRQLPVSRKARYFVYIHDVLVTSCTAVLRPLTI